MYELKPEYDARKSFYGKAVVYETERGKDLYSYGTRVAGIDDGKAYVRDTHSATTLRHIKEFLKQHGFKADSKAQIERDY